MGTSLATAAATLHMWPLEPDCDTHGTHSSSSRAVPHVQSLGCTMHMVPESAFCSVVPDGLEHVLWWSTSQSKHCMHCSPAGATTMCSVAAPLARLYPFWLLWDLHLMLGRSQDRWSRCQIRYAGGREGEGGSVGQILPPCHRHVPGPVWVWSDPGGRMVVTDGWWVSTGQIQLMSHMFDTPVLDSLLIYYILTQPQLQYTK